MANQTAVLGLEIKSVDENRRLIRGIANSGQRDRAGEIVDVLSARFAARVPLLIAHKHDRVVGSVRFGTPTREGLPFEATMPQIDEPGPLKDRVDTAWLEVRHRLINKVSIGFGGADAKYDGGVWRNAEIHELSLVAVPADSRADILEVSAAKGYSAHASRVVKLDNVPRGGRGHRVVVLDSAKRAEAAYAAAIYERMTGKQVPVFWTDAARDKWRARKRAEAKAKGVIWLDPFDVASGARRLGRLPRREKVRLVRLDR